jgi:hypothetical protein
MIWLIIFLLLLFKIKGYYLYKYFVIESGNQFHDDFLSYVFTWKNINQKIHSTNFFPLIGTSKTKHGKKAKLISNLLLISVYLILIIILFDLAN